MSKKARPAVIADVPRILALLTMLDTFFFEHQPAYYPIEPDTEERIQKRIQENAKQVAVATNESNEVVGILFCTLITVGDTKKVSLWSFYVATPKQGYGKILFEYAKAYAKENDCATIELRVDAFNQNAYDFYKHLGMETVSQGMEYILKTNNAAVDIAADTQGIRIASAEDVPHLLKLVALQAEPTTTDIEDTFYRPLFHDEHKLRQERENRKIFVSQNGFAVCFLHEEGDGKRLYLSYLCAPESDWQQLWDYAKQYASANDVSRIQLHIGLYRPSALAFCIRQGMVVEGYGMRYAV